MRFLLSAMFPVLFLAAPTSSWAENDMRAAVTAFLLEDLEYTLLSAPSPNGDPDQIQKWCKVTQDRILTLELLAGRYELDGGVVKSIETVRDFLGDYRKFVNDLRLLGFVHGMVTTQGDSSGWKNVSRIYSLMADGPMFLLGMEAEMFDYMDEKMKRASFETKVNKLKQEEMLKEIDEASEDFNRCAYALGRYSAELSKLVGTPLPSFNRPLEHDERPLRLNGKPFATVAEARSLIAVNPSATASLFLQAVGEVPDFGDRSRQEIDLLYRVPWAQSAASLFEFAAQSSPHHAQELFEKAVAAFDTAETFLPGTSITLSYPHQVSRARALAGAGQRNRAIQAVKELRAKFSDNPIALAIQHYDLAIIHVLLGEREEALIHLKNSYAAKPRSDPYALSDPMLAPLVNQFREEVEMLADHPLIGGTWTNNRNSSYVFDPNGSLWQRRLGVDYTGRWKTENGKLTLFDRNKGLADGTGDYRISPTRDQLSITVSGYTHEFRRANRTGVDNLQIMGRVLQADGSWTWEDTQLPVPSRARFYMFRSQEDEQKREFWFVHEDPLLGRINDIVSE